MIKYSDASNMEKTAQATITSQNPMQDCCHGLTKIAATGEHRCGGCGNRIAVVRNDD